VRAVEMEAGVASELEELRRVKKQYERLKVEHELLKKAIEFTSTRRETSSPSSKRMKGHTR
jgi:transposase